ncbi:MAG: DUF4468 domain-containing protein [Nitrospinae bacterium]|nr:DUF4468 domain-containing protein [Nitrospinota bacterium]
MVSLHDKIQDLTPIFVVDGGSESNYCVLLPHDQYLGPFLNRKGAMQSTLATSLFAAVFICFNAVSALAEPVPPFSHVTVEDVDISKGEIYIAAMDWMTETFRSSKSVIEFEDKEAGVIVGKGNADFGYKFVFGTTDANAKFKIKIEAKDGRYRLTFSNVTFRDSMMSEHVPVELANRPDNVISGVSARLDQIKDSFVDHVRKAKAGSDF